MPKRYEGNSGRFRWMEPGKPAGRPWPQRPPPPPPGGHGPQRPPPPSRPGFSLLPKLLGELETEDLLLLLLCYLFYRESGDSDWLITIGALILS